MRDLYAHDVKKEISTSSIFVDYHTNNIPELTPQDYRTLHALYNKSHIVNGKVDKEKLEKTVELIDLYENNYYSVRANLLRDNYSIKYNYQNINEQNVSDLNVSYEKGSYKIDIDLNNGMYDLNVINRYTNEKVASDTGDYLLVDGVVILKNVDADSKFYRTNVVSGYDRVADLMLFQTDVDRFTIIDVSDISNDMIINKDSVDFNLLDLRNNFFEIKQNPENNNNKNKNTFYKTPCGQTFTIEMDEETDELGLFKQR